MEHRLSRVPIHRRVRALAACAALLVLCGACAPKHETPPPDPAARAQALIDAGNTAYRAGDFKVAARRYAAAAVERPDEAAAFYGLGMALSKLGRDEDARAAYAKARELAHQQSH